MTFTLELLGGIRLLHDGAPLTGPAAQRHRLALLALLAASPSRAASRDRLMAWLWPSRDGEHARRLLNQAVHALRRALGAEAIISIGDELRFNPAVVACDLIGFEEALAADDPERAVAAYGGPLLDGFFRDDAPELERWVDRERERLADAYSKALEELAEAAERASDWSRAAQWWKARTIRDPYDSRLALRLMRNLERAGNRAGALQHAQAHRRVLLEELEIEPDPEVLALAERLRREPPLTPPWKGEPAGRPPVQATIGAPAAPTSGGSEPTRGWRAVRYGAAIVVLIAAIGVAFRQTISPVRRVPSAPSATGRAAPPAAVHEVEPPGRGRTTPELREQRTRSIPAYELYLRGSDPALLRSDSAARVGLQYFHRAIALDSTYAAAWAGLARLTLRVASEGLAEGTAARAEAEAAARRAVTLDDSLAEAHGILGIARSVVYDFAEAERHFRRAIELEPAQARFREWAVDFYLVSGRPADALAEAERALRLEPLSPSANAEMARALLAYDRCDEALALLGRIAALDPPLLRAAPIAAQCYARKGMWGPAIAQLRPRADQGESLSLALLGYVLARAGRRDEALAIQARLVDRWRQGRLGASYLAIAATGLGDHDQAFAWLDLTVQDRSRGVYPGARVSLADPALADLAADPRFAEWRRRIGLAP